MLEGLGGEGGGGGGDWDRRRGAGRPTPRFGRASGSCGGEGGDGVVAPTVVVGVTGQSEPW